MIIPKSYTWISPIDGRFTTIDPLCEKYPGISPYVHCNNNPLSIIDPTGLEGVRHIDENGNKSIETNVVILVDKLKEIPADATASQIKEITKQNEKTQKRNDSYVSKIKAQLESYYNNAAGSDGEPVTFKFNYIPFGIDNTKLNDVQVAHRIALKHGLDANVKGRLFFDKALAVIISQAGAGSHLGTATGMLVRLNNKDDSTLAHEVGHTFGLKDNFPQNTGGLMDYPVGRLTTSEVDKIWHEAFEP